VRVFLLFRAGRIRLLGADEPRYAQIAREMLARHDWIVPTLNGSPLAGKTRAALLEDHDSYSIFGVSDWAARVPALSMPVRLCLRSSSSCGASALL